MDRVLMAEMTSREYALALKETDAVIIPVGSTEVLGGHGPLGGDYYATGNSLMTDSNGDGIGDLLQEDGLACLGRGNDQPARRPSPSAIKETTKVFRLTPSFSALAASLA